MNTNKPGTKPTLTLLNGIAFYQLVGGAVGLVLAIRTGFKMEAEAMSSTAAILLACILYLYSIFCGVLLLKQPARYLTLSMVNQVLQVLSLGIGSFAFNYVAGLKIGIGVNFLESWVFKLRFSISSFQFILGAGTVSSFVTVNLLALVLLYLLEVSKDKLRS
ncbi:hypothetical protein [Sabulibacter ruber]|uniref:hypothetical protein n=1 Tax=Sabulibacter ruber TaxID=2811901 RepID=UPI001A9637BA|nr:hypothetical protein [Sabulibacter ruber]